MADPLDTPDNEPRLDLRSDDSRPTESSGLASEKTSVERSPHSPDTDSVLTGSTLGPYRLLEKLGEGGMGAVYKAQHEHLDKLVAIKVLSQQITRHPSAVGRFKREMKAVGKLSHPNIVLAHDAGEIQGIHYLAMEYVVGTDLSQLVKQRGPMSVTQACDVIRQAAEALAAAHAVGLVHRDIKPANLLLATSGQIKLLDLGLALLGDDAGSGTELTSFGQTFGTPDYMPPEQWEDAHLADPRTDLYALGCTLFFVLVGRAPFGTEQHRSAFSKMRAHADVAIPDLRSLRTDVPETLSAIYRKLLAKSPAERFQTAAQLADALSPFCSIRGGNTESPTIIQVDLPDTAVPGGLGHDHRLPKTVENVTGRDETGQSRTGNLWKPVLGVASIAALILCGFLVIATSNKTVPRSEVPIQGSTDHNNVVESVSLNPGRGSISAVGPTTDIPPAPNSSPAAVPPPPIQVPNIVTVTGTPAPPGEAPSLLEWLKGRTILTVSQDGRGKYKTITEALNALQSGQVVQVLDRGPYREVLRPTSKIPADCGLVSDMMTSIMVLADQSAWQPVPQGKASMMHHLNLTGGFRLHGFYLAFPERPDGQGLVISDPDGLIMENCFLRMPPGEINCRAVQLNAVKRDYARPVLIRECLFDGRLGIEANASNLDVLTTRNFFSFTAPDENFVLLVNQPLHSLSIRHNVFSCPGQTLLSLRLTDGTETVEISNNTFASATSVLFEKNAPRGTLRFRNNIFSERGGMLIPNTTPPEAFGKWEISFNACREYPVGLGNLLAVPPSPTDLNEPVQYLSEIPVNSRYLRIPLTGPLTVSEAPPGYIGALPPGPAPIKGDWFTRLRTQWGDTTQAP